MAGPRIVSTTMASDLSADELLRLAASLDQASKHVIAETIVEEAHTRNLDLAVPSDVVETPGEGIEGRVDGRAVIVGGLRFVSRKIAGGAATSVGGKIPRDRLQWRSLLMERWPGS